MKHLLPIALLALAVGASAQDVPAAFAKPFTSHAVLQRDCELPIWGTAKPGAKVVVKLDDTAAEAVADADGKWCVRFPAQTQPGLGHTLVLSVDGADAVTLDDIAIGDVWLCSGQSNMDMSYGWGLTRGKEDVEKNAYDDIRLFDDHNAVSFDPLDTLMYKYEWKTCSFESARTFSACGYFFGAALHEKLPGVPLGLIEASWSGSPIKTWLSAESYSAADPACAAELENLQKARVDYDAQGGKEAFEKRLALWTAETNAKGDIPEAFQENYDDSTWTTVSLPTTFEEQFKGAYDGCVWYRRTVTLTTAQAAAANAVLHFGAIDDKDITYVNGQQVGECAVYNQPRDYKLPAGLLREGANTIVTKTFDFGGGGGFTEKKADALCITFDGADTVPLAGEWKSLGFAYDPKPVDAGGVSSWTPCACYNAMLHPLFPMAVKGAIWYQGCSDVGHADLYDRVFRAMAADWRAHFTHPDGLPVYLVQLASFMQTHDAPFNSAWADMRWTHMKLGETLEKSGSAVAIDIGHPTDIHPKDKKTVGERLARLALVRTYGQKDLVEAGPIPVAATYADGKVTVAFKNATDLIISEGDELKGFQLGNAEWQFQWVKASIQGPTVVIDVPEGMEPAFVRYAWDDFPVCNLVGAENLPCGPFHMAIVK